MHSTWPSGNAMARRIEGPEFDYGHHLFFFSSFLFSFCLIFLLLIAVLFLYIALVFFLYL